jgi:hypothetical protein
MSMSVRAAVLASWFPFLLGCDCSRSLTLRMFDPENVGPDFDARVHVYEKRTRTGPDWYTYYSLGLIQGVSSIYAEREQEARMYWPSHDSQSRPMQLRPNRDGFVTISDVQTGDYIVLELAGFAPSSVWVRDACSREYVVVEEIDRVAERHHPSTSSGYPTYKNPWPHLTPIWHHDAPTVQLEDDRGVLIIPLKRRP